MSPAYSITTLAVPTNFSLSFGSKTIKIYFDGTVDLDGLTPDQAAMTFWGAVAAMAPSMIGDACRYQYQDLWKAAETALKDLESRNLYGEAAGQLRKVLKHG